MMGVDSGFFILALILSVGLTFVTRPMIHNKSTLEVLAFAHLLMIGGFGFVFLADHLLLGIFGLTLFLTGFLLGIGHFLSKPAR
ncbi:hypothetical protein [Alkalicoccus chagannorensis]|uniref:hypothetical protein n=1 Tax=Alkalicoccus chagannorensis TaxID=427072 RepID=UPI000414AF8C|nr:hypothetical protein [Alkalicoccus chagannorensis]